MYELSIVARNSSDQAVLRKVTLGMAHLGKSGLTKYVVTDVSQVPAERQYPNKYSAMK